MLQKSRELIYSLLAIVFITIVYLLMVALERNTPAASSFYGHAMGVLGFVLMLMTEILYTVRKRMSHARWGRYFRRADRNRSGAGFCGAISWHR